MWSDEKKENQGKIVWKCERRKEEGKMVKKAKKVITKTLLSSIWWNDWIVQVVFCRETISPLFLYHEKSSSRNSLLTKKKWEDLDKSQECVKMKKRRKKRVTSQSRSASKCANVCEDIKKCFFFFSNARADSAFRETLFDEFLIRMCLILCEGDLKNFQVIKRELFTEFK